MCLSCQLNKFPFFKKSNFDLSLLNSGFHNFELFSDTNIFLDEDLKLFFTKFNSMETPFNDSDYLLAINSKYYDVNDFNKLKINENSPLSTLHLNVAFLSKHFQNLHNFLPLIKHSFDIIGIIAHKVNKKLINIDFNLSGYGIML